MRHWYYAQIFTDPSGLKMPGTVVDSVLVEATVPPCAVLPKCDESNDRILIVLCDPYNTPAADWVAISEEQARTDYPGLIEGVD